MKRIFFLSIIVSVAAAGIVAGVRVPAAQAKVKIFSVYADAGDSFSRHFVPSGWMGDHKDVLLTTDHAQNPHSGTTCIRVVYRRNPVARHGWAGIVWQHPENNWGERKGAGIDLSATSRLTFWARGEWGGECIEEFKVGGTKGAYPDSDEAKIGPVVLTAEWRRYTIDLTGKNLTYIIGGFAWAANLRNNPRGCIFYLDDIRFE